MGYRLVGDGGFGFVVEGVICGDCQLRCWVLYLERIGGGFVIEAMLVGLLLGFIVLHLLY